MAIIHKTTMVPGKLDLLAGWMPAQPWYAGPGREPALAKVGGFRLDDPEGQVGIEFMVVTDHAGDGAVTYQVPLTYRSVALPGAEASLIGTTEHGVLGRRWIYDGTGDPVLVAQLVALIQGEAEPQAQSLSNTPDPTVTGIPVTDAPLKVTRAAVLASGQAGTDLRIETAADGTESCPVLVRVHRILHPGGNADPSGEAGRPCLSATWRLPDGTAARGVFATARYTPKSTA
jgi:Maltokinase N-terminal cap domain